MVVKHVPTLQLGREEREEEEEEEKERRKERKGGRKGREEGMEGRGGRRGREGEEEGKEGRKGWKGGKVGREERLEGRGGRQDIIEIHIVCSIIENVKRFELDNKASPSPLSSNFHPLPPWGLGVQWLPGYTVHRRGPQCSRSCTCHLRPV